jgi:hypothetical protein
MDLLLREGGSRHGMGAHVRPEGISMDFLLRSEEGKKLVRRWSEHFAQSLIGPKCPPAKGLPEDMRLLFQQLVDWGGALAAAPEDSLPDAVE